MEPTERDARLFGLLVAHEWGRLEDLPLDDLAPLGLDHGSTRVRLNDPVFWDEAPMAYAKLPREAHASAVTEPTEQQIDELRRHYLWRY